MYRTIQTHLQHWKNSPNRLSLLLRGARQVGKTHSIRELGRSFQHLIEVNFEEQPTVKTFFERDLDPARICEALSAFYRTPIRPGETLLFFDEVQACPAALQSMRFFHEKMPALHVVAAGSLLEFALSDIPTLGVGRITSLYLYPLSFVEFIDALGEEKLIELINNADEQQPLHPVFHEKLISLIRIFQIIGGLPAAVKHYVDTHDLNGCADLIDALIVMYQDDFAKYKKRAPVLRLRHAFQSIAYQAGNKFKYVHVDSDSGSREIKQAVDLIIQAGLAYKVFSSNAQGVPLGAQINEKRFKILPFDLGIYQRLLGLDPGDAIAENNSDFINKGASSEIYVGTELIKSTRPTRRPDIYYWHRETKGSNAEVDYVIQRKQAVIPIEVKAGTRGSMQSLWRFLATHAASPYGIRLSMEPFSSYVRQSDGATPTKTVVMPLYAAHRASEYEAK